MENKLIDNSELRCELVEATQVNVFVEFTYKNEEYTSNVYESRNGYDFIKSDLFIQRTKDGLDMSNDDELIKIAIHYIDNVEYGTILEENYI